MTIGFIGLGLTGGSLAKSIRRVRPDIRIIAYNRSVSAVNEAIREGVIDQACFEITSAFEECDIVFLCVPVLTMKKLIKQLLPHLKEGALITDVGSTKGDIHAFAESMGLASCFIGGHPMAGSERKGYEAASDRLFENAFYILTPGSEVSIAQISSFSELISSIGALPLILTAEEHDHITAAVSHLPHVVSASLVNTVKDLDDDDRHLSMIAAGGFKDITRISSSSPQMWQEICAANADEICIVLERFIRRLTDLRFAIRNGNTEKILSFFTESRDYRDSFESDYDGPLTRNHRLYVDIVDEPGAIAQIATLLAEHSISIKNIGIVNNRAVEGGVLRVEFYQADAMNKAAKLLKKKRFKTSEA